MDRRGASIFLAGLLQGTTLVAFPAASTIITGAEGFNFNTTQYGSLFIPQALLSILSALCNPFLCRRCGTKAIFIAGLVANYFSMSLLALSVTVMHHQTAAYALLISATALLGMGFGMLVPTINRVAEELYPLKSDSAVLTLNALLGVGTALAPLFIALFTSLGFWWGLPLSLSVILLGLLLYSLTLTFPQEIFPRRAGKRFDVKKPELAFVFIAFAFLYGIIETLNGNWVLIFMHRYLDSSFNVQSLALTSFWGMVTFGRVFFAAMSKYLNEQKAFEIAPFISGASLLVIASLTSSQEYWAVIAFGLTGFGCSILLPLLISFGGKELKNIAPAVPGMIISSYLLGYGVAAFGVGPLEDHGHMTLREFYVIGAVISFALGLLSLYIVQGKNTHQGVL